MKIEKGKTMLRRDASPCSPDVRRYEQLSDRELCKEIVTVEKLLLRAKEGYTILVHRCEMELDVMRQVLTDRIVDICRDDDPAPEAFRRNLEALAARRALPQGKLQELIRKVSKGRARSIDELNEIQALVVWFCLGGDYASA